MHGSQVDERNSLTLGSSGKLFMTQPFGSVEIFAHKHSGNSVTDSKKGIVKKVIWPNEPKIDEKYTIQQSPPL